MFLIDANALIEAKNRYYAFDIAPGFWDWLDAAHSSGTACSIDAVRSELLEGADELAEWARARKDFFRPIDEATIRQFGPLTSWVTTRNFTAAAQAEFAGDQADYLLIAYGKAHGHTVVTHELSEPLRRNKVKIPDACIGLGVAFATPFDMLRQSSATLRLET
jgi:hypothetical protein